MATLVKFIKNGYGLTAVFPQLKYNKALYGNELLTCYALVGQHHSCSKKWVNDAIMAIKEKYAPCKKNLKVLAIL